MNTTLETKFLFDKIKRIYPTFEIPDEFDIGCWTDILKGYSQDEIILALKSYRKTIEYNTPPTPATFSKFLHQENGVPEQNVVKSCDKKDIDPALCYYLRDIESKPANEVHALLFYRWAIRDIIIEKVDTLPNTEKMSFSEKVGLMIRNGWDIEISERIEKYIQQPTKPNGNIKDFTKMLSKKWNL